MNNGMRITADVAKINKMFDEMHFDNKDAKKATRKALSVSINLIRNQARRNLSAITNAKSGTPLDAKGLRQFVRSVVYKNSQGAMATILDDKRGSTNRRLSKKGLSNKSFIVKFFETGTRQRWTKGHRRFGQGRGHITYQGHGGYRGVIAQYKFFSNAVESKQLEARNTFDSAIIQHINKVFNKSR